jgi:aminopeptidase N
MTEFVRLSKSTTPVNYALELKPCLTSFTFEGSVVIDVNVNEAASHIELNSAELKFDKAVLVHENGSQVETSSVALDDASEVAKLHFAAPLTVGPAKLHIQFVGDLNDKLKGFYRSKYIHPNGEERYAATTQFEAADARRAFPCWDEPAVKATFDVTLIADETKTVLSNMVA